MSRLNRMYPLLISWDRDRPYPEVTLDTRELQPTLRAGSVDCLWHHGFIANRAEIISKLGLAPSISDSAILMALYVRNGKEAARLIAGPFAWIIWDANAKELVAVRDRIGIQGLYYAAQGTEIILANRVELLLRSAAGLGTPNLRSIAAHINAEPPLDGETFYAKINAVVPGGILSVTQKEIKLTRYWRVAAQPTLNLTSDAGYADRFRELLFKVVAEYVPAKEVGVTLSGGMDSTTVAAALKSVSPDIPLVAFSWVSPELPESDESEYSSAAASYLGLPTTTLRADLHWPLSSRLGLETRMATPFCNAYTDLWMATYEVIRQCGITVLFSGYSGDHLFGGDVFSYPDLLLTGHWVELVRQVKANLPYSGLSLGDLIRVGVLSPIAQAYLPFKRKSRKRSVPWLTAQYQQIYLDCFADLEEHAYGLPGKQQRLDHLRDRSLAHIAENMNLLADDYEIELRHPLCDHRLFEFAATIPSTQTYRAAVRKIIMRNAMRGYLPDQVVGMIYKILPSAIVIRGLREREQSKVMALMTNMRAAEMGFVDERRLNENYSDYVSGKHDDDLFWDTLTLEDWLRRYF